MMRSILRALLVLGLTLGAAVPGWSQSLDDYLDQSGGGQQAPIDTAQPRDSTPADEKTAVSGFVTWLQSQGLIEARGRLAGWWTNTRSRWDLYRQSRALKAEIEKKFNISLREGGLWFHDGTSDYKPTCWSIAELQAVKETLEHCPESFRTHTRYINRARAHVEDGAEEDYGGMVWNDKPSTVFMFDPAADPGTNHAGFKRILVHEMMHCYQNAQTAIETDWNTEFWAENTGPGVSVAFTSTAEETKVTGKKYAPLPAGSYPLGSPVSAYGAFAGELGEHRGAEDQAEAVSFAFANPGSLSAFPKREAFLKSRLPVELFDQAHAPETGGSGSWGQKEDYHYTYIPVQGQQWYDLKGAADGDDLRVFRLKGMAAALGFGELDEEDIQ